MDQIVTTLPFNSDAERTVETIFTDDVDTFLFTTKYNAKGQFWQCNAVHRDSGYTINGITLNNYTNNTASYPELQDLLGAVVVLSDGGEGKTPDSLGSSTYAYKVPLAQLQQSQRSTDFPFDPDDYIRQVS